VTADSLEQGANFKFKAFISYSHADQSTAAWLHKAIETYSIPKELRGTAGRDGPIPKQLFPVFRDRDELSSCPDLSRSIHEALQVSAYLIVLCSPAAGRSKWVNQEIIEFKKLGRSDRIHALIVEGDPAAAIEDGGCFPPALRCKLGADGELIPDPTREVLAADLREEGDGKNDAKLKLIAGLLGIAFNALRRREVAAARRRLLVTQAVAAAMALLVVAAGVGAWLSWHYSEESDERQVPGLRVEYHETTLDLSGWRETTPAQMAHLVKVSSALSHDRYTIVKTQPQAVNYVHTVGTSSPITPDIMCTHCVVKRRAPDAASRTPNEFKVEFDISNLPLERETTIDYTTRYWNAFQTPDQWWTGLRVSDQTEMAKLSIIFPPLKHPPADSIRIYYHDQADHFLSELNDVTMEKDSSGRVANLTWMIANPSTDRSYRVRWNWNDLTSNNAAKP
jgi:MTH538 TIR-like domain (DUF1863)